MKKIIFLLVVLLLAIAVFVKKDYWWKETQQMVAPLIQTQPVQEKLRKYSFENLRQKEYPPSQIKLEKVMKKELEFTSYLFSFLADGKKVSGQANIPINQSKKKLPVVVMVRGHIDDQDYFTGAGTYKAAAVFAKNGFITLAPDFLGFGKSDSASGDILEARFEKPITVLSLLASIGTLPTVDTNNVFLWGHSNGGQITISVLEISQRVIPATLWAPVTRGFPDSVLTYMGDMDDQGEKVKEKIDEFMANYNPKKYSIDNYLADIKAPIMLHQGTNDPLVSITWSDNFVNKIELLGKDVTYHKYRGDDHNLKQDWEVVVQRDVDFFKKYIK